jgi:hypothetical protein
MDQKESFPQHVAEWCQCGGRRSAWARNGSGEAWNQCFLDRCAYSPETKKEKTNATLA